MKSSASHAEHDRNGCGRFAPFGESSIVASIKGKAIHDLSTDKTCVAGIFDLDFAGHFAHNHFKVLVGNRDTLGFVNCLDLLDQVILSVTDAADTQDFLDILRTTS